MDKKKKRDDFLREPELNDEVMDSFFDQDIEDNTEETDDQETVMEGVVPTDFYQGYITHIPLLSKEKELEYGMAAKYGSEEEAKEAKNKLIEHNMRYVLSIANRFQGKGLLYDDIVQEGFIGLMKAADKYDPDLGWRFTTYATWWIKQSIQRAIMDQGRTIRIPVHLLEDMQSVKKAERAAAQMPDTDEMEVIMKETGFTMAKILHLRALTQSMVSLDTPIGEDQDTVLGDVIAADSETPEDRAMQNALAEDLRDTMADCLNQRESEVISHRFGLGGDRPKTLEEVGAIYGVTRECIRQIEVKALRKLRNPKRSRKLREYTQ